MWREIFQTISVIHAAGLVLGILVGGASLVRNASFDLGFFRAKTAHSFKSTTPKFPRFTPSDSFQPPEGWRKVSLSHFSYWLPPGMRDVKSVGIDSAVWRHQSGQAELAIDLGMYSGRTVWNLLPGYREERRIIGGVKTILSSYWLQDANGTGGPYVFEANFHDFEDPAIGLTFRYYGRSAVDGALARQIFSSISFHPEMLKR